MRTWRTWPWGKRAIEAAILVAVVVAITLWQNRGLRARLWWAQHIAA